MHIITVCGNGIGSSLMLAGKVEELCEEEGIKADVESMDLNGASSANPDLFITVKELAPELHGNVVIVRSYVNKKKIREDALEAIKAAAANAKAAQKGAVPCGRGKRAHVKKKGSPDASHPSHT